MILDKLENSTAYHALNSGFVKAFDFLMRDDLMTLSEGEYKIDGERVFAIIANAPGRDKKDALLEAHKKYIDIQLVLAGIDNMGWKATAECIDISMEYNDKKDVQLFKDMPDTWLGCKKGTFAIFFPNDAHMPSISGDNIHKVIVKVAVE